MATTDGLTRRSFLADVGLFAAATTLLHCPGAIRPPWASAAAASSTAGVQDTFNGLLAFIVPGPDEFSQTQGVTTQEPGGVDAGVVDVLIATLDESAPYQPSFSALVAAILNDFADVVNPTAGGFASLRFAEKVVVFQLMDATDPVKPLAGVLPAFTAYLAYSEAGVLDPETRELTGTPVGWTISGYQGVAEGRDEFRGYYRRRRSH